MLFSQEAEREADRATYAAADRVLAAAVTWALLDRRLREPAAAHLDRRARPADRGRHRGLGRPRPAGAHPGPDRQQSRRPPLFVARIVALAKASSQTAALLAESAAGFMIYLSGMTRRANAARRPDRREPCRSAPPWCSWRRRCSSSTAAACRGIRTRSATTSPRPRPASPPSTTSPSTPRTSGPLPHCRDSAREPQRPDGSTGPPDGPKHDADAPGIPSGVSSERIP